MKRHFKNKKYIFAIIAILLIGIVFYGGRKAYSIMTYKGEYYASLSEVRQELYDKLKIKSVDITERITGVGKFDTDSSESVDDGSVLSNKEGIDVSNKDDYVRTFDTMIYTLEVGIDLNTASGIEPSTILKGGVIKINATLPTGPKGEQYLVWRQDSWMKNVHINVNTGTLTAEYHIPSDASLVGGNQELTFTIDAYGYTAELLTDETKPKFEIWMEGNQPDNENSKAPSVSLIDERNIYITGKEIYEAYVYNGKVNTPTLVNGIKGNYINFNVSVKMPDKKKGMAFPTFENLSGKLKLTYSYKDLDGSNNNWTIIDENNEKSNGILNGVELIAYNQDTATNNNAKPLSTSNKYNDYIICVYLNSLKLCPSFDAPQAALNNDVIDFDVSNIKYSDYKHPELIYFSGTSTGSEFPISTVNFEVFVPYYDMNGGNYDYKLTAEIIELKSDNQSIKLDEKTYNNSATAIFEQNIDNLFKINVKSTKTATLASEYPVEFLLTTSYGPIEGGTEQLITWNATHALFSKTTISSKNIFLYGIYKNKPTVGLSTIEEINGTTFDDFNWYETLDEANENGTVTAVRINSYDYLGFDENNDFYIYFHIKEDPSILFDRVICRRKIYAYLDKERTNVISLYGGNEIDSYMPTTYENNSTISTEKPSAAGETSRIKGNDIEIYLSSDSRNYLVEDIVSLKSTIKEKTDLIKAGIYLYDDLVVTLPLPPELTFIEGTENYPINFVHKADDGQTFIQFVINNHIVGDEIEPIHIDAEISPFVENNKNITIIPTVASLKYNTQSKRKYIYNGVDHTYPVSDDYAISFNISNLAGSSIRKNTSKTYLDKNESFSITDSLYNVSEEFLTNVKSIEKLPKTGDSYGNEFSGDYTLKIQSIDNNQKLYYSVKNFDSLNITSDEYGNLSAKNIDFANDSNWIEVNVGDIVPKEATALGSITASIDKGTSKKYSYQFIPNGNKVSDKYLFRVFMTSENLTTIASSAIKEVIVGDRGISGKVFMDNNYNNIYDTGDSLYSDFEVNLLDSNQNIIATTKTDKYGYYEFINLSKGNYYVSIPTSANYDIASKNMGLSNNSNVFNSNGYTDLLTRTNSILTSKLLMEENVNLGIKMKKGTIISNYYVEGTTTSLAPSQNQTIYYGFSYSTTLPTSIPSYYELVSIPENASGIVNGDVVVNYYYRLKSAKLTVHHYIEGTTNEFAATESYDKKWTDEYTTSPTSNIDKNYELVSTPNNASGIIRGDVVVNYYYRLKSAKLTVHHYIEGTTNELADTENYDKKWTDEYTTSPSDKVSVNYELVGTPNNASGIIRGDVVVNYYYKLKSATITVNYYIEDTTTKLDESIIKNVHWGDEYSTDPLLNASVNYELVGTPNNASGTISGDVVVNYYYRLKGASLTVHHYIEGTTKELTDSTIKSVHWGDNYTTEPSDKIDVNYELVETPSNASGTIASDSVVVTYYYRLKSAKLTIHHYIEGTTTELADTENYDKKWTDEYTTKSSDKIDINYELVETPSNANGIISGDTIVIYYYKLKSAKLVVHHYIEGTTTKLVESESYNKKWTDEYTTSPSDKVSTNYELVSTPDNSSGVISGDVEVTYYYRLKKSNLIVKYIDKDTNEVLAEVINKVVYYGEEYKTEESSLITANYELHSKSDNYEGVVSTDKIEVIYYYQKKDSELSTNITKEGPEKITDKKSSNKYTIAYEANIDVYIGDAKITITDKLPYKIDEEKSLLDDGIYNEEDKTITWIIEEKDIDASIDSKKIEITKNIELVYTGIDSEERTMSNTVVGIIELDNNDREVESQKVTYIKIPGKIIVHHYLTGTEEKVVEDEETEDLVGETYISSALDKEGYKLIKEPEDKNHKYKDELTEVIYEYEKIRYDVITKVEGDSQGGSITGDESVFYGDNSTENNIVITPKEGFEVSKIIINGEEIEIDECRNGCVLGAFLNITSNQEVVVIFSKKVENPNTKTFGIGAVKILLIIFTALFIFIKKQKEKFNNV